MKTMEDLGRAAKLASRKLAASSGVNRNLAIEEIAKALIDSETEIISENSKDIVKGKEKGLSEAMLDRLTITTESLRSMSSDALMFQWEK